MNQVHALELTVCSTMKEEIDVVRLISVILCISVSMGSVNGRIDRWGSVKGVKGVGVIMCELFYGLFILFMCCRI